MKHLVYLFKLLQTQEIGIKFKNYNKKAVLITFYNKKDWQDKCTNRVCRSEDDKNDRTDLKTKHRRTGYCQTVREVLQILYASLINALTFMLVLFVQKSKTYWDT